MAQWNTILRLKPVKPGSTAIEREMPDRLALSVLEPVLGTCSRILCRDAFRGVIPLVDRRRLPRLMGTVSECSIMLRGPLAQCVRMLWSN